jgi:hypothetical protein
MQMALEQRCGRGDISFALAWEPEPSEIPARACTCSFCVKHGGVWTSCPTGSVEVTVREPSRVSKYSFGTKTAQFHVCAQCGAVPVVTSRIDGRLYAVVSVNAFDKVEPSLLRRTPASFEGENEEVRLARRKRARRVRSITGGFFRGCGGLLATTSDGVFAPFNRNVTC